MAVAAFAGEAPDSARLASPTSESGVGGGAIRALSKKRLETQMSSTQTIAPTTPVIPKERVNAVPAPSASHQPTVGPFGGGDGGGDGGWNGGSGDGGGDGGGEGGGGKGGGDGGGGDGGGGDGARISSVVSTGVDTLVSVTPRPPLTPENQSCCISPAGVEAIVAVIAAPAAESLPLGRMRLASTRMPPARRRRAPASIACAVTATSSASGNLASRAARKPTLSNVSTVPPISKDVAILGL